MALRDTSWITAGHANVSDYKRARQTMAFFTGTTYTRTRTIITSEWVCLTYSAAKNYADSHAGDANTSFDVVEQNRIVGEYKLVRLVDSQSAWA